MPERSTSKRACLKCEYMNPRQALYCLRCGEIFRPVMADTPWEYLSPEREQRRAEALGKVALQRLRAAAGGPSWLRLGAALLLLAGGFAAVFEWNLQRKLGRVLASDPAVVTEAIWKAHSPRVERHKRPFIRHGPTERTLEDPFVAAWAATGGLVGLYLMVLGMLGMLRRELRPAHLVAPLDVFYPWGAFWSELISGRRVVRPSWKRMGLPLFGAPAVLVAGAYWVWGLATAAVVPAAVYYAELRMEGWDRGLKALGLVLPPRSQWAERGLWAERDGTVRRLAESQLSRDQALDFYAKSWGKPRDGQGVVAPAPDGGRLSVVALEPSLGQEARGFHSVLSLSLTGTAPPPPPLLLEE